MNALLQKTKMTIKNSYDCKRKLGLAPGQPGQNITNNMFCAEGSNGSSGCHGDSGGPFVCKDSNNKWVIRGVISWGSPRYIYSFITYIDFFKIESKTFE